MRLVDACGAVVERWPGDCWAMCGRFVSDSWTFGGRPCPHEKKQIPRARPRQGEPRINPGSARSSPGKENLLENQYVSSVLRQGRRRHSVYNPPTHSPRAAQAMATHARERETLENIQES